VGGWDKCRVLFVVMVERLRTSGRGRIKRRRVIT
jgi:hypothetical protein